MPATDAPGVIEAGNLYVAKEARQRLQIGQATWRQLCADGLPVVRRGRQAYVFGDDTSKAAAATIAPKFGKRQRQALAMILGRGVHGATNEEVSTACGWLLQSTCPVTYSLAKAGLIEDSGQRRTTSTGCPAKVWTASEGKD